MATQQDDRRHTGGGVAAYVRIDGTPPEMGLDVLALTGLLP